MPIHPWTRVDAGIFHAFHLPAMPLFLRPDRYINVPLEVTYLEAFRTLPAFWREILERPANAG